MKWEEIETYDEVLPDEAREKAFVKGYETDAEETIEGS